MMQKVITGFAALLVAVAAMAQTNQSQIAGFATMVTQGAKMDLFGVSFQKVGGEDIDIQDIQPGAGYSSDVGYDLIRVWDPLTGKYVFAYHWNQTYDKDTGDPLGPGWGDIDENRLDTFIVAGQGYWLTTLKNASAAVAGEVLSKYDDKVSTLANKMDLFCNTFPAEINIQDVTPVSGVTDWGVDLLRLWDPDAETYVSAYYCSTTYDSTGADLEKAGWADYSWIRLDVQIAVGQGFWLTTVADSVVKFPVPLVIEEED